MRESDNYFTEEIIHMEDRDNILKDLIRFRLLGANADYGTRDGIKLLSKYSTIHMKKIPIIINENDGYIYTDYNQVERSYNNMLPIPIISIEGVMEAMLSDNQNIASTMTLDKLIELREKSKSDDVFMNIILNMVNASDVNHDILLAKVRRISLTDIGYNMTTQINQFTNEVKDIYNLKQKQ